MSDNRESVRGKGSGPYTPGMEPGREFCEDLMSRRISPVIPGFGLTLGYTLVYLSLLVLIPLGAMFVHAAQLTWDQFWTIISAPRVLAALKLSFSTALAAAVVNGLIGTLLAWVLVRYTFPGRKIIDAMIDLPFALPTAVAGIALTALYAPSGMVGQFATCLLYTSPSPRDS